MVDIHDECLMERQQQFIALCVLHLQDPVLSLVVVVADLTNLALVSVDDPETNEIVERHLAIVVRSHHASGKEHVRSHNLSGIIYRVDVLELHKSRVVGTETVLLNEERHKYAVDLANQVITVHTVKNIVGEDEDHLTGKPVCLGYLSYLDHLFLSYHDVRVFAGCSLSLFS